MGLKEDPSAEVVEIFRESGRVTDAIEVPDSDSVTLGNEAQELEDAVVLYADLSDSTKLVDANEWGFAAEAYKTFLHGAAKVIILADHKFSSEILSTPLFYTGVSKMGSIALK